VRRRVDRPRRARLTVGLSVAAAALATGGVLVAIVLGLTGSGTKPQPGKIEGVVRDLTPTRDIGKQGLHDAAGILQARLAALGVPHPTVTPDQGFLRAYVPAASLGALTAVATTKGVLRFRQALAIGSGDPGARGPATLTYVTHAPTLSRPLRHTFATWRCSDSVNPTRGREAASDFMIACSPNGVTKYLLAPTAVPGHDITSVAAGLDTEAGTQWVVAMTFNGSGSEAWQHVTERAYNVNDGQPSTTCHPPNGCNAIAITLDGVVQSAPYISQSGGIPGGRAEISGSFNQASANRLAAVLKYGALPTAFAVRTPAVAH
jgi:preprotein translocase subunit SecD